MKNRNASINQYSNTHLDFWYLKKLFQILFLLLNVVDLLKFDLFTESCTLFLLLINNKTLIDHVWEDKTGKAFADKTFPAGLTNCLLGF